MMGSFRFEFWSGALISGTVAGDFLVAYPLLYSHGEWSPRQDEENIVRIDLNKVDTIQTEDVANGGCENSVMITFKDDGDLNRAREPIYFAFEAADEFREFLSEVDISGLLATTSFPCWYNDDSIV